MKKNILLIIAIILIIAGIWYLQSGKARPTGTSQSDAIGLTESTPVTTTDAVPNSERAARIAEEAKQYQPAHEIIPGGRFINSSPFTLKSLIGKRVILLDFWTYSCINCQRTTPYLNAWYKKYKDQGLVIVGVHTPEFDFEKDYTNVVAGTKELGIQYPVVQDNNYATWQSYGNQYWPREYLINIDGYIVHDKIGEGGYDKTEQAIQAALQERSQVLVLSDTIPKDIANPTDAMPMNSLQVHSPEIYFGSARNEYLGNGTQSKSSIQELSFPVAFKPNTLYLDGTWDFQDQYAVAASAKVKIVFRYNAKNVYFVASADKPVKITIMQDDKVVGKDRGSDVSADGTVIIQANRLYKLISGSDYGEHTLEIIVNDLGLRAYTFTFG